MTRKKRPAANGTITLNAKKPREDAHPGAASIEATASEESCLIVGIGASDEELRAIFTIVKARTGHDFSSYKSSTVMRRIERRMAVNDVGGFGKYIALLEENSQEAHALSQDILIGVTSFFRDPDAFETVRREIIPRLFADRDPDEPVRIWHACCATGEEVYSMAILIREYLNAERLNAKVQFFATDIDEAAIAQARAGLYAGDIAAEVGEERLKAFFTRFDSRWQVAKQLREMIVFAHHSLIKDPPFSRLDLLVCRNFLIYLTPDMQKRLITLFHQVLKPGGFLFLGSAETVGRNADLYAPIDKKWKIFARLESGLRAEMPFPFTAPVRRPPGTGRPARPVEALETSPSAAAEKLLMERYSPPCVVVNEKYEVVHVSTRANRFLEVPVGEPTRDILKMSREELRPALRAAIYKAFSEQKQMAFRGVKIAGGEATVNVLVEPLGSPPSSGKLAMVVFEPASPQAAHPAPAGSDAALAGDEASRDMLIRQLEEQLRITHEQLQTTTEQLETSHEGFLSANEELMSINEEFQSANEELQSTNEELETSKEELQALNEELVTVNAELQGKVEELNQANSDMENLLTSSEIATLFLDRSLTIKRFTPAMAAIFNLIPADIGRPFRRLAGAIDWSDLVNDAETVLEKLIPIEREVTAVEYERCYLMRVLPYRTTEGSIDGIVVTLIDITERKRMEEALLRAKEEWERTFDSVPDLIAIMDDRHRIVRVNRAMAERLGVTPEQCVGLPCHESIHGVHHPPEFCPHTQTMADSCEHQAEVHEGRLGGDFLVTTTPLADERGHMIGSVHVARDITERKRAEEARARLAAIVESSDDAIIAKDLYGVIRTWNAGAERMFGYRSDEAVGRPITILIPSELQLEEEQILQRLTAGERFDHYETVRLAKDSRQIHVSVTVSPIKDSAGRIIGASKIVRDITEHKKAEEALRQSEQRVRLKLESIISPEGDIGNLELADIIDAEALQLLVNEFYQLSGMPMGLIDLNGKVLVGVGWQDVCTKFHRVNPETCRNCVESDVQLSAGVPHGEYKIYKCKNNMWDVATPIMIGDRHFGNLFIGQFFFEDEPLDYELFRSQAREFGFDEREYIAALEAVPRLSRETLNTSMGFFMKLADILSKLSYSNLKLARSLAERDGLMASLRESEERFRVAQEFSLDAFTILTSVRDKGGAIVDFRWEYANPEAGRILRHPPEELVSRRLLELLPGNRSQSDLFTRYVRVVETGQSHDYEMRYQSDGINGWFRNVAVKLGDGVAIYFADITERKRAEEEIRQRVEELRATNEELTRFNDASVGRELRMIELKKEINELCRRSGQPLPYPLDFEEGEG